MFRKSIEVVNSSDQLSAYSLLLNYPQSTQNELNAVDFDKYPYIYYIDVEEYEEVYWALNAFLVKKMTTEPDTIEFYQSMTLDGYW